MLRPVTMETRCFHKKLEFRRYPPKDFCTARYEHGSSKKSFKLVKNPEKRIPGPILGEKQMFVRSGGIPSPGQTSIDKKNDCAIKSERGALVRGSVRPTLWSQLSLIHI